MMHQVFSFPGKLFHKARHALRAPLNLLLLLALVMLIPSAFGESEPLPYFPGEPAWNPDIPSPASFFGFEVGDRHLYHHELVRYLHALAESSERVAVWQFAESHGGRPQILLAISSPENIARRSEIREAQTQLRDPDRHDSPVLVERPLVLWFNHGVHGDEPSATNVVPLLAYALAADRSEEMTELLERNFILIEPCVNPDGLDRFAAWTNDHRGRTHPASPVHREHVQPWVTGRLNYYWFDLNRDYFSLVDPAMEARVREYYRWLPNLLLDYHEMGSQRTYFFQPGVPGRDHPGIPSAVRSLTQRIANGNAAALDEIGVPYFTREIFDDYFVGKASTFGDFHGGIGILYEQGSSRGMRQETPHGLLTFRETIRNQLRTCLATLRTADQHREAFLRYQETFYASALDEAASDSRAGYLVAAPHDRARIGRFLELMRAHRFPVERVVEGAVDVGGAGFVESEAFFLPLDHAAYRYQNALFALRTDFDVEIHYDITAWSLPLAFNLQFDEVSRADVAQLRRSPLGPEEEIFPPYPNPEIDAETVAIVLDWRGYHAPSTLYQLLQHDIPAYRADLPFTIQIGEETVAFPAGSVLLRPHFSETEDVLRKAAAILREASPMHVRWYPINSYAVEEGIDLGSPSLQRLTQPKILLLGGRGVQSNAAGELWHLFDERWEIPVSIVETHRLHSVNLADFTHIVVPQTTGNVSMQLSDQARESLRTWLRERGGVLLLTGNAVHGFSEIEVGGFPRKTFSPEESNETVRYAERQAFNARHQVRGVILKTLPDPTHPLSFGLTGEFLPVLRHHRTAVEPDSIAWRSPIRYAHQDELLLAGQLSSEVQDFLAESAAVSVRREGRGTVIAILDNPAFRGHWYGGNRVLANAIFFSQGL